MDKDTLEALKGSIKKWFKIAYNRGRDLGPDNCDLCKMFFDNDCEGCPVSEKVEDILCENTPHENFCLYCFDNLSQYKFKGYFVEDEKSQQLAIAEYEFLKSLLPEDHEQIQQTQNH